jgi:hypothetical protein
VSYGSGSFSGKYFLSSPIRFELIECRKYRYRVHRPSYNHHRACHPQAINWCCFDSKLPTLLLSSNHSFLVPTLVNRFCRRRWYHWVSYILVPQDIDANSLFLVSAQSTSLSVRYPLIQTPFSISHVLCRYFES